MRRICDGLPACVVPGGSWPFTARRGGIWRLVRCLQRRSPMNTADYNDTYAILSRDELTMYFTSDRPGGVPGPGGVRNDDLWFTTRASLDDPWETPTNLAALNTVLRTPSRCFRPTST
jgi:hypothetical protein